MSARETGKQRAARIPLDYFKSPDRLVRVKGVLTIAALVTAGAWAASGLLFSSQGEKQYSHGPLAAVHATWEENCEACHVPFSPISGGHWLSSAGGGRTPADARCEACHAGPPHHPNQKPGDVESCASCHRDHQGRNASLVAVPDQHCTNCHADLAAHTTNGKPTFHPSVTRFAVGSHPEFKGRAEGQRGQLKFNHTLHLTSGLNVSWQLKHIRNPAERERFRQQQPTGKTADTDFVQLDCASCHQLDAKGEYFLPITYDNQCKACHPLTFDERLPNVSIPHGLQPAAVRTFLWGAYVERAVQEPPTQQRILRPLPAPELREEEDKVRKAAGGQVSAAEAFLFKQAVTEKELYIYSGKTTCGECHHYESKPGQRIPERIVPPAVPNVWFEHARFSHSAHRAVSCQECHARTPQSTTADDVLLPGIADCFRCHAPLQRGADGSMQGGARFQCTECHRYHHGQPGGARGAKSPGPIEQFLSGTLSRKLPVPGK
ncbi:MAG: hypothetical protein JNM56_15260 [Planctomycetia bacterium]|nr:hypothetical protein [Planctomycetia bacterium]